MRVCVFVQTSVCGLVYTSSTVSFRVWAFVSSDMFQCEKCVYIYMYRICLLSSSRLICVRLSLHMHVRVCVGGGGSCGTVGDVTVGPAPPCVSADVNVSRCLCLTVKAGTASPQNSFMLLPCLHLLTPPSYVSPFHQLGGRPQRGTAFCPVCSCSIIKV